ncbi:MAG: hypothetical protein CME70_10330 [Halobacteriovorax sp.]|nr:hypothetical protein [Halobacteriovorax sp.]|tara:strand:- start:3855 stop:5249 length:1395 start_codon:yes stop_codon:yes gene_type:complete
MAGIGFRLTKYFEHDDLLGNIKGSIYSIIISTGPWLISVLAVAFVSYFAQRQLDNHDLYVLKAMICYTYAGSLILFGAIEMPVTRFLADKLYIRDLTTFRNVFLTILIMFTIVGAIISAIFYSFFDYDIVVKFMATAFFISVLAIWVNMIFLSAAKNYHQIVISFFIGGVLSVVSSLILGNYYGLGGYVLGFSMGQAAIAVLLTRNLFSEFADYDYISLEFVSYFKRYRTMIFVGLFYYLGIWVDKFIFWFAGVGEQVEALFYTNQYYDTAMFLAYLTIVPSFAVFLVQVETNFYVKYAYYFRSIESKNNLKFLNDSVSEIIAALKRTTISLLKIQTFVTIITWYFSEQILNFLHLPSMMEPMFKYGVIGAYLQILFLVLNIILLYFKQAKQAAFNYGIFFVTNTVFSLISTKLSIQFFGLGYLLSCLITLIVTFVTLNQTLGQLNYLTFMRQPLTRKNFGDEL